MLRIVIGCLIGLLSGAAEQPPICSADGYEDYFTRRSERWMKARWPKTVEEAQARWPKVSVTIIFSKGDTSDFVQLAEALKGSAWKDEVLTILKDERVWKYVRFGSPDSNDRPPDKLRSGGQEHHLFFDRDGCVLSVASMWYGI